mgnify:FL=1
MSRILPFKKPSWDYTLWNSVSTNSMLITEEDINFLSRRDTGENSSKSKFWKKEGRESRIDGRIRIIDFIGLNKSFDTWFTYLQIPGSKERIIEEIKIKLENKRLYPGGQYLLDMGINENWLEIDWGLLGRIIGSAIANEGNRRGWWLHSGRDSKISNDFWLDLVDKSVNKNGGYKSLDQEDWKDVVNFFIQHNLDVESEISRGLGHGPTNPIIIRNLGDEIEYTMSPLAYRNRERMRERYREHGKNNKNAEEYAKFHGQLTFSIIKTAMTALENDKYAEFILIIQGLCANHIMRTQLSQQKIGMHLFSNLAIRKLTRGVSAIPLPDIAQELSTGFGLSRVLSILHSAELIDWYTVDIEHVNNALTNIKNL